jgi:hypothetical protein
MASVPRPPMHRFGMAYAGDQDGWVFEGATARGRSRYLLRFWAPTCDAETGVCGPPRVQWSMVVTAVLCPGDYWIFRVPGGRVKCLRLRFVG